jgi:hypothetical protein
MIWACEDKRFSKTSKGYPGIRLACMKLGDVIVVLCEGKVPYILRQASRSEYALMGKCVIYDIMNAQNF